MNFISKFPGGIHPPEGLGGKKVTSVIPIMELPKPSRVVIPLQQNIGAPCIPLVKKGDTVLTGQRIGEPTGPVGAAVHASVSGTVAACEPCILPNGTLENCVIIYNDFQDNWTEPKPVLEPEALSPQELGEIAREAGIVGMGGAMFPYGIKLAIPQDKSIDTLILNGSECEPYITADHRLMLENSSEIIQGALLIQRVLNARRVVIGIKKNKQDAIEAMRTACGTMSNFVVQCLPDCYPQGGEKQLTYAVTKRVVKIGGLPLDCGVLVCNVASVYALWQAVYRGRPLVDRVVTVCGYVQKPANYRVRIGTPVEWLIETVGGFLPDVKMLIYGGPMMGLAISRQDIPVCKNCSAITALGKKDIILSEEGPCIRCGRCVDACPMKLEPATIDRSMRKNWFGDGDRYAVLSCMECGICSWICPSRRNLTQSLKVYKKNAMENRCVPVISEGSM